MYRTPQELIAALRKRDPAALGQLDELCRDKFAAFLLRRSLDSAALLPKAMRWLHMYLCSRPLETWTTVVFDEGTDKERIVRVAVEVGSEDQTRLSFSVNDGAVTPGGAQ